MTIESSGQRESIITLLARANELRREGSYDGAIEIYREAAAKFGASAYLFRMIALCYFLLYGKLNKGSEYCELAIYWMTKAIALNRADSILHSELAEFLWIGLLDLEHAAEEYRIAIELDPNNVRALSHAAGLYGQPPFVVTRGEADSWSQRLYRLKTQVSDRPDPDDPIAHATQGELYFQAGRQSDAEAEWQRALLCAKPLDAEWVRKIMNLLGYN